jgi:mycothiol synthase
VGDLSRTLFGGDTPAVVRGDPEIGVVATVVRGGRGHIRLLVVAPEHRRQGVGSALLATAEEDLRAAGADDVRTGADAPDYLWPGVDVREVGLLSLLERRGFWKDDANFNMSVDLAAIPEDPGGWIGPDEVGADELRAWLRAHYPNWEAEALPALERGVLVASRDESGLTGYAAWDVNRRGWFGPTGVRPDVRGRGLGTPLLLAALHQMRASGLSTADIAWVGPIGFYAGAVGATINRVFFVFRKKL